MQKAIKRYESYLMFKDLRPSSINSYVANLKKFLISVNTTVPDVNDVEYYLDELQRRKINPQTWNQIMYSIQHYFKMLGLKWSTQIKKKKAMHKVKQIPPKEKIMEAIRLTEDLSQGIETVLQKKIILLLAYDAEERHVEIQKQLIKDIDFNTNQIIISEGKGFRQDVLEISQITINFIKEYLSIRVCKENPYLLSVPKSKDRYRSYSYIGDVVKNAGKLVGYMGWHPHLFRASAARHRFDDTGDIIRVSNGMRHKDIKTTLQYLNLTRDDLQMHNARRYIPLIDNKKEVLIGVKIDKH